MRRIIYVFVTMMMIVSAAFGAMAQDKDSGKKKVDRKEWFDKMRQYKHRFLIKELNLTEEQQPKFFEIYDAMEAERMKAAQECRRMEKRIDENPDATTDADYLKAARAMTEVKCKEEAVVAKYFDSLGSVLSPRQMYLLQKAESKFTRKLMQTHFNMKEKRRAKIPKKQ